MEASVTCDYRKILRIYDRPKTRIGVKIANQQMKQILHKIINLLKKLYARLTVHECEKRS